ncbi:MAG TPA: primosomal protein N' [Solimonas sp.]
MSARLISVAVPVPLYPAYDYRVPADWEAAPRRGCRVRVPFGRRTLVGVVIAPPRPLDGQAADYKPAEALLDAQPLLPAELLGLCEWAAGYYQHPLGEVLAGALPGRFKRGADACYDAPLALRLTDEGRAALETLPPRQRALRGALERLIDGPQAESAIPAAPRRRLLERGWIAREIAAPAAMPPGIAAPTPTAEQAAAWTELRDANGFAPSLLEGVTGSGKTELYLRLIEEQLAQGRQALVLAPEISLTPQLLARFRERLGAGVVGFHSGLGEREREQAWLAAREGQARVVVGTRSAVFVPFARLGLIIVDEEHDASYKQQDGFRYSARDVAVVRAQKLQIPVLLGSATPSLETLHNARAGRYRHVRLLRRVQDRAPPRVRVLDVRGQKLDHGLSPPLLQAIDRTLAADGQALLFINRRGYAPLLLCHTCAWSAPCTQCDARMTLHRGRGLLICHHCGAQQPVPRECPSCGARALTPVGQGTERIEQALANRFPQYRVERFDSDRVATPARLTQLLDDIRARRIHLLVGTQILAKGHDFPGLALVGIVSADQALYGADFRAIERMGQLVTQVAGRAGRAEAPGEVWLQTHEPEHPLLRTLVERGYGALSDELLREREITGLPPYAHLVLLRAESQQPAAAMRFLDSVAPLFADARGVTAMAPIPSGMERRAGYTRAQLLLQSSSRAALHRALAERVPRFAALPQARAVRWSVDVDPADLM